MPQNWIVTSGYSNILRCFYTAVLFGLLFMILFISGIARGGEPNPWYMAGFVIPGIAGVSCLLFGLRCSNCRGWVAWHVMRHSRADEWLNKLVTLTACPLCGHHGNSRATSSD
jgi:hypothetical protein